MENEQNEEMYAFMLLRNLVNNEKLDIIDKTNIRNWFTYKFWEVVGSRDKDKIRKWTSIFTKLEMYLFHAKAKNPEIEEYLGVVYVLGELLTTGFGVDTMPGESISTDYFEYSFNETVKKLY